jgi:hypothetical protein
VQRIDRRLSRTSRVLVRVDVDDAIDGRLQGLARAEFERCRLAAATDDQRRGQASTAKPEVPYKAAT